MAFQSSVFRDGQWVTETVNLQDALRASAVPKPTSAPRAEPPVCGLFSTTIVESPVVHWALPVRLRSRAHNDVAFIGDRFVQISELRADGQVHEVIRKNDFGARIRNAIVFGASFQIGEDHDAGSLTKLEEPDILMQDSASSPGNHRARPLPPQLLILMLETGDAVFLFVEEQPDGRLEFVVNNYKSPRNLKFLGFHLSVDPTFRYMAAASVEGAFIVYELETLETLNRQYLHQGTFNPIKSIRVRSIRGIIHKMEFLYPRPEDDYHIILLLIVVRHDRPLPNPTSRMVTYEWELGDELKSVFAEAKSGNRLPDEHKMPLLLIPLRFKTAFFAVSQHSIGIVKYALSGSPQFETLQTGAPGSTRLHHGTMEPLWTAWARPFRRKQYLEKTDIIYLAREDGVIIHIEIDSIDLLPSVTTVGSLDTNISTAFTAAFDIFSDILIIGGDSGPGGIWKLAARSDLEQVAAIPNWSPVIDLATTDTNTSWLPQNQNASGQGSTALAAPGKILCKPDRIFCISGRGLKSSVTELRWGIQARIGLDIDFDQPIRQSWMFPVEGESSNGFYAILSLPDATEVIHFSGDLSQVNVLPPDSMSFDLGSRTIYAGQSDNGTILQVTERSIAIISLSQSSQHHLDQLCNISGLIIENAYCEQDLIVISSQDGHQQRVHILRIDQMGLSQVYVWDIDGPITFASLFTVREETFVATGSMRHNAPFIAIHTLDGQERDSKSMQGYNEAVSSEPHAQMEAFTSLCIAGNDETGVGLVCGTRSGHLVTSKIPMEGSKLTTFDVERLGTAPCNVFSAPSPFNGKLAAFACCDNNLFLLTDFAQRGNVFKTKNLIIPTDANNASMPLPLIHSVYGIKRSLYGHPGHMSLMLLAGSRILLADIWSHVGPVPRTIPLDGTPLRMFFSRTWRCLIVGHFRNDGPSLSFIDPESGAVISMACDKERNPVESISGLGHQGDRIFGLCEWLYVKDGKTFPFIIVTTKEGGLLIVSVEDTQVQTSDGPTRCLKYWTRYKKRGLGEPVYSVIGDAENLIYCVGDTLHWEVLDLGEKKLVPRKRYRLDSPATSLRVRSGKVWALTIAHSLQIFDLHADSNADISLIHSDSMTRYTNHQIEAGNSTGKLEDWPINILSTSQGGVAGVWIPWGQRNKEFSVLFDGTLPNTVRRFRRGHTRPIWATAGRGQRYNSMKSTVDGAEILGVALDGSLQHFTLIGPELWRFLRLLQNLAHYSAELCPATHRPASDIENWQLEPEIHPKTMHIDGDLLRRCLDLQALEGLANMGDGDGLDLFCEYLDAIDGGAYTEGFEDDADDGHKRYFELGYSILEHLLAPVF